MMDLRNHLYQHMTSLSLRFFTNTKTGEIMSRLNNDVGGVQDTVTGALISIVYATIIILRVLIRGIDVPGYASLLVEWDRPESN